jgi:LysR family cyn operon transcriptional activator
MNLALPARGFITRRFVDDIFEQHALKLEVNLEINDIPTLIELVETGGWHSILTDTTVQHYKNLVSIPIRSVRSTQQAAIITLVDIYEKQSMKAFFEVLLNR